MRVILWLLIGLITPLWSREPNIIFILTDNHGDWTLGCYGNKVIKTPNIDRLAREGMRFANAFANNPVCSPNRATLLTGLMPSQHGVHSYFAGGPPQTGAGSHCVIRGRTTLGEILKRVATRVGWSASGISAAMSNRKKVSMMPGSLCPREAPQRFLMRRSSSGVRPGMSLSISRCFGGSALCSSLNSSKRGHSFFTCRSMVSMAWGQHS